MTSAGRAARWVLTGAAAALAACTTPPENPDDLCAIFREKRSWHRAAVRSFERWGTPEWVQLAVIFRESSFRADARPERKRWLGILPGRRISSAYGYGQVLDDTWHRYQQSTGRYGAHRDDFGDVTDFIGWYADHIQRRTGVSKKDARALYLAYHEGPAGFARGTHRGKIGLQRAAREVAARAARYRSQYPSCRDRLARRWWWPF